MRILSHAMSDRVHRLARIAAVFPALIMSACGGGGGGGGDTRYTVGGTVSGLIGSGLLLQDNGQDNLAVAADGTFVFKTSLGNNASYSITVQSQPTNPPQNCAITNGSGTVASANVTSAVITCTTQYTVGGTATGVAGTGLVLQLNGGNDLSVPASGSFVFAANLAGATAYTLSIKTQPSNPTQLCTISNATGTIAAANVTAAVVSCTTMRKIGGTVQGLSLSQFSSGVVLQNNGNDTLTLKSNGSFAFATLVPDGSTFNVNLQSQPTLPSQTCVVTQASGVASGADIGSVAVNCSPGAARFASVANTIGAVNVYTVQPGGGLQSLETVQTIHGGLRTSASDPSGQFLYFGGNLGYIEAYRVDQTSGMLSQINGSPFLDLSVPAAVVVDPTARFIYVANSYGGATSQGSVSAFTIDAQSGALAEIPGSPYTVNYGPRTLAVDPSGRFLYVPTAATTGAQINVTAFAIDPDTGTLSALPGSPFTTSGGLPTSIVVHPNGSYLYVQSASYFPSTPSAGIAGFSIDPTSGALSALPGPAAALDIPFGMAITPSSGFVYGTSSNQPVNTGSTSAYAVNPTTGALSEIGGSPFIDTQDTTAVTVDPLSGHLYVASQTGGADIYSGAVYVYDIDATTGALSNRQGPFSAGDYPYALVVY